MTAVSVDGIVKRFGPAVALDGVSLDLAAGEFVALLGGSGCGKTTLLRIIAGFAAADRGTVRIGGAAVDALPAHRREVGFVFQSYALFPTKTVADNIGFGLMLRGRSAAERRARVAALCTMAQLAGLEDRYPHELSGGQQQRVALVRALAPEPRVLLLDEPLSALDAQTRVALRDEIRSLVDRLGVTTNYVTHDQEEALAIADRIAVMDRGRILQTGKPADIYLRPADSVVAGFIGVMNRLPGRWQGGGVHVPGLGTVPAATPGAALRHGDPVVAHFRPEHVALGSAESDGTPGQVARATFLGPVVRLAVSTPSSGEVLADMATSAWSAWPLAPGERVHWAVPAERILVFAAPEHAE